MAIGGLALVQALVAARRGIVAATIVPPLVGLVAAIHTGPAMWLAAAGAWCCLAIAASTRARLTTAVAVAAASAAVLLADRDTRVMIAIGNEARGDLNLAANAFRKLSYEHTALIWALVVMAGLLALVAVLSRVKDEHDWPTRVFNVQAGALGVLSLAGIILLRLVSQGKPNYYPVAKCVYFYAPELALLVAQLVVLARPLRRAATPHPAFAIAALFVLALPQKTWASDWTADQSLLVDLRAALAHRAPPVSTPMPFDERLAACELYYLFIGPLDHPRDVDAEAYFWNAAYLDSPAATSRALRPSDIPSVVPAWSGKEVALAAAPPPSLVFFGHWEKRTIAGRAVTKPAAHVLFRTEAPDVHLCVRANGRARYAINGEAAVVADGTASLPLVPDEDGNVALDIEPVGESTTISSLWLAADCAEHYTEPR